jgi:hypothetical protein
MESNPQESVETSASENEVSDPEDPGVNFEYKVEAILRTHFIAIRQVGPFSYSRSQSYDRYIMVVQMVSKH